jgi:hypothetical protein
MVDDSAIRSVRVASVLCDRFAELLKGPTTVVAGKTRRALIGVKGNEDELSLRLGEAQQIYPEIWSHLDEARKAFAARGVDLSAFDLLRENERQFVGTGAAVNVKFQQFGDPGYGYQQTTKTAHFNTGGLQRARAAIQAIQNATPNINWAAIAKAEDNDPHVAAFRRALIVKRIWMFAGLLVVLGIPFWWVMWKRHEESVKREKWRKQYEEQSYQPPAPALPPRDALPAAEQAALLEQTKKIAEELQTAVAAWPDATRAEALSKLRAGTEPCAFAVIGPPKDAALQYIKTGDAIPGVFAQSDFLGYLAKDPIIPNDAIVEMSNRADSVVQLFHSGRGTPATRDRIKDLDKPLVFVIIDKDIEPKVETTKPIKLEAGKLAARGYVFDPKAAKVVCAATLDVKGSDAKAAAAYFDTVEDGDTRLAEQMLHRELEVRLRDALAANLKAVAP